MGADEETKALSTISDEPEDDLLSTTCSWMNEGSCRSLAFSESYCTSSRCTSLGAGPASYCFKMEDEGENQEEGTKTCTLAARARIVGRSGRFYEFHVEAGNATPPWTFIRRYHDFKTLDAQVRGKHSDLPQLPQRSFFFRKHFKPGFTERFEEGLAAYVEALVSNLSANSEPAVQRFLGGSLLFFPVTMATM